MKRFHDTKKRKICLIINYIFIGSTFIIKSVFKILEKLGGISLFITVIIFCIVQYNSYVEIGNSISVETGTNILVVNSILSDKDKTQIYLHLFSNQMYNSNWNFIAQYYNDECFQIIRRIAFNVDSLNVVILRRQDRNILDQEVLYTNIGGFKIDLEKASTCKLKSWWSGILYNKFN